MGWCRALSGVSEAGVGVGRLSGCEVVLPCFRLAMLSRGADS